MELCSITAAATAAFLIVGLRAVSGSRPLIGYEIRDHSEILHPAGNRLTIVKGALPTHLMEVLPSLSPDHDEPCDRASASAPFMTLSRLVARLEPGGWLEGQTPAAQSLEHHMFGTYWSGYHAPRHTVVFSREGLRRLLERVGLKEVQSRRRSIPPPWPSASPRSRGGVHLQKSIRRAGLRWPWWLGCATLLCTDRLASGSSGIVNFMGVKR